MMTIPWWLFLLAMAGAMWIGMGVMAALSINRGEK